MPNVKPKRRWFQFSLRSLMLLVTLIVGLLVAWRVYVAPYVRQQKTLEIVQRLGGRCQTEQAARWVCKLSGREIQNIVLVDVSDWNTPVAYLDAVTALPCLETLVVGGLHFGDNELRRVGRLSTLRWLILDSTTATDEGIADLQRVLPRTTIRRSQRRAIANLRMLRNGLETRAGKPLGISLAEDHFEEVVALNVWAGAEEATLMNASVLPTVEYVHLFTTSLDAAGWADIRNMPGLRRLDFFSASGKDTDLVHLAGMTNLREISLSNTPLTDAALPHLRGLTGLETLNLRNARVSDAGVAELCELHGLRRLFIRNTAISEDGVRALKKRLPNCWIDLAVE